MIKWSSELRCSEKIAKKAERLKKKISSGKLTINVYVVAYAVNQVNLFDIINVNELLFNYYKVNYIHIVGLAESREAAEELVCSMVDEIYNKTGAFDVRAYFG